MKLQNYALINTVEFDEQITELESLYEKYKDDKQMTVAISWKVGALKKIKEKLIPAEKLAVASYMQGATDYCKSPETINQFKVSKSFLQSDIPL